MLGSKNQTNVELRAKARGVARWGMFGSALAVLVLVTGCPGLFPPTGTACTADNAATVCDDNNLCTTDTCGANGFCANDAVVCAEGETCDEMTGVCGGPCTSDADCPDDGNECTDAVCTAGTCGSVNNTASCDDGDMCTDGDACADGVCGGADIAGCCEVDADCAEGEVCDTAVNQCGPACASADDCVDDDPCTDDACVNGACVNDPTDVSDGLFCNGVETCDPATGDPVDGPDPCDLTTETCNEDTDACDPKAACETDADCLDTVFCNGDETCNADGDCVAGTRPCNDGGAAACADDFSVVEICSEGDTAAVCTPCPTPTKDFTLDQDNLIGTSGNDSFTAPLIFNAGNGASIASLQTGDSGQGLAGVDDLSATLNGTALVPTLSGIENQHYTVFVGTALTATNISGVDMINSRNSTATLTVTALQETTDLGLENITDGASGISATFATAVTTGTADKIGVTVNGSTAGAITVTTGATNGFEEVDFTSSGSVANSLTALTQVTGTSMATAMFSGSQALTIRTMPATVLTYDGSGLAGGLTLGTGTSVNGGTNYATFATANLKDVKTGSGDDLLIFNNTLDGNDSSGTTEFIDLGTGTDVVQASLGATIGTQLPLRNAEEVRFNATANGVSVNLGGVTGLTDITIENDGAANTFTLLNVPGTPNLNFRGNNTQAAQTYDTITYTSNAATGAADVLNVNVNNRGTALNSGTATTNVHTVGGTLTAANIETVNVTVTDGPATFGGITAAAATSFSFTASSNLTLGTVAGGAVTSVSAGGVVGNFSGTFTTLGAGAQVSLGNGTANTVSILGSGGTTISINGGSGADTITGSAQADVISGGAGIDSINSSGGADTITGGSGADTFRFASSVASGSPALAANVTDWTDGDDILGISAGNTFGGGAAGLVQGAGAPGSLVPTPAGSTVVLSVAQNAAAVGVGTTQFLKLTTGVATGASDQATFNAAIGTATVTGLNAGTDLLAGSYYDTTTGQAVIVEIDSTATANTTIQTGDTVRVIARLTMTAGEYTNFTGADILIF